MEDYGEASGAKVNKAKGEVLGVGNWRDLGK